VETPQNDHDDRPVADIAGDLGEAARELYERFDLRREVDEHPYRTVLVAAGVGYVLGGGLFSPLTRHLLRLGFRVALVPMAKSLLQDVTEGELFD
jgi:hypothetical protein